MTRPFVLRPTSLLVVFALGLPALRASAQDERRLCACDFEKDTGILQLEARGAGFTAQLDPTTAHSGRQSVKLVAAAEGNWTIPMGRSSGRAPIDTPSFCSCHTPCSRASTIAWCSATWG